MTVQPFDVILTSFHEIGTFSHKRGDILYCLKTKYRNGHFSPVWPTEILEIQDFQILGRLRRLDEEASLTVPKKYWCVAEGTIAYKAISEKQLQKANTWLEAL